MIVEFDKSFEKSLKKIRDTAILNRLARIIVQYENSPSLVAFHNVKKLTGYTHYYRIRIGDYRVGFESVDANTIRFIIIAHRKDIYKIFP